MGAFLEAHPRDPHPAELEWATETLGTGSRIHWLIVRELGSVEGESDLEDWNEHQGRRFSARTGPPGAVSRTACARLIGMRPGCGRNAGAWYAGTRRTDRRAA